MSRDYYALCGITEEELHADFGEYARVLSAEQGIGEEEACALLKEYYDGYHFAANVPGVYNPFSLLNAFKSREFGNYWFETGTPTYLVELLKRSHYDLRNLVHEHSDAASLDSIDTAQTDPIPVLYQSGYLTIHDYDAEFGVYTLGFPNKEVEAAFIKFLVPYYTPVSSRAGTALPERAVHRLQAGGTVRAGGIPHFARAGGPPAPDAGLCVRDGIQTGRDG